MKYLLAILLALGLYHWYSVNNDEANSFTGTSHTQLIMYSLSTCGYCKQKRNELRTAGIPFVEYFIDKDTNRRNELVQKLTKAGYRPSGQGVPMFDAYGYLLLNNPPLSKILAIKNRG